ncbi:MAG TPA: hypothetical protein VFR63_01670 [Gaiellaceae bacterium]|nr:hypothetical protein [Gaiellaceae bacterium]
MGGRWARGDLLLAGGAVVGLAASAETAWSLRARFALDLEGLSAAERAGIALWDFRPLPTAVFAGAAVALLLALADEGGGRLVAVRGAARTGLVLLAGAHAALAVLVLGLAVWIAAAGEVGERGGLGFAYSADDRAVTLATQAAAWVPLALLLGAAAVLAAREPRDTAAPADDVRPAAEAAPPAPSTLAELEALWRERLALGPRRERGRLLLQRIRAAEEAGDAEAAGRLAAELRALVDRSG